MDEPEQNNIDWIDWWVKQQIAQSQLQQSPTSLELLQGVPPLPKPINDWQVYYTSADSNDCLIHSLLMDLSPTFRTLKQIDKDSIAREFRIGPFLNDVVFYYTVINPHEALTEALGQNAPNAETAPQITDIKDRTEYLIRNIKGKGFLKQEFLKPLCMKYKFNVLFYSNSPGVLPFDFEPNGDHLTEGPTIVMYNPYSVHFSAMSQNGNFFFDTRKAMQFKEEIMESLMREQPDAVFACNYKNGDGFIDNTEERSRWTVVSVYYPDYPASDGVLHCNSLRIESEIVNEDGSPVILDNVPIRFFQTGEPGRPGLFDYNGYIEYLQNSPPPPPSSPVFGSITGRAGSFDAFPDDNTLVFETELKSHKEQETKPELDPTLQALAGMKNEAAAKLKKLEFVQWFFDSGVPLDCENLKKGKLTANINKRLDDFLQFNLLDKLYNGLISGAPVSPPSSPREVQGEDGQQAKKKKRGVSEQEIKKQALLEFFTSSPDMVELCKLAKLDLVLNNVSKFYEVARQPKYADLFDEKGQFIQPPLDAKLWNDLLKQLQKRFKFTRANVSTLLPYLEGSNALLAYRKAATLNLDDFVPGPIPPSIQISKLEPTKWLRELLTTYRMPGFPIQIAIDFEREDISDAFVKDMSKEDEEKALKEDYSFLNGKEFVKNMVTNRSIPTTFKLASEFAGNDLKQKLVGDYFETQKIPFLEENAPVFISREITEEVEQFERLDKNPEEFDQMPLSQVSVPLFIIFSCLKRKKLSRTKIWQILMPKDITKGRPKPENQEDENAIDTFMAALTEKNLLYSKNDKGEYIFEAFHTSIIILCNGKIYTLGYGSDPFYDAEQASAQDGDAKIKYLKKMEGVIKTATKLRDVQILGTGFIYSPDSLNIEDEELNYRIVDVGILKKSNIVRLNKILATVKQTRAITMVIGEDKDERVVTVEQFSCQTRCIYSRLATRYTQSLPFASQLMNCSSFVELAFPERIDCTAMLGYSDPNACRSKIVFKVDGLDVPIGQDVPIGAIFDAYFAPTTTIGGFKEMVGYISDVPSSVRLFNNVFQRLFVKQDKGQGEGVVGMEAETDEVGDAGQGQGEGVVGMEAVHEEGVEGEVVGMEAGGALKLKNRKKQKRPKNTTARKSSNKLGNK